jgi:hypothetical protein
MVGKQEKEHPPAVDLATLFFQDDVSAQIFQHLSLAELHKLRLSLSWIKRSVENFVDSHTASMVIVGGLETENLDYPDHHPDFPPRMNILP